jgi:competence protein ComEC
MTPHAPEHVCPASQEVSASRQSGALNLGCCLFATVCWLAGVALQTSEAALLTARSYQLAVVMGTAGVLLSLGLVCSAGAWRTTWRGAAIIIWGLACASLLGLAWGSTGWRASARMAQAWPATWQGSDLSLCVEIEGLPQPTEGGGRRFDARVLAAGGSGCAPGQARPPVFHIALSSQGGDGLNGVVAGQRWALFARLHSPDGLSNPGGFDSTLLAFERGVRAVGSVRSKAGAAVLWREAPGGFGAGWVDRARQRVRDEIHARVKNSRAAAVLAGLAVGDQGGIDRADWDVFRRTGIAHLVSISGTHIAMLGSLAAFLVRCVWSRWLWGIRWCPAPLAALWAGVLASLLYALLAGWGVPAQRTVLMMAVMAGLRSGAWRWPWPLVWLISAVAVVIMDPWALRQVGFWLSYVAVGVLMSAGGAIESDARQADLQRDERQLQSTRAASLWCNWAHAAWPLVRGAATEMGRAQALVTVALAPLAVVCFGQVSVVGVGANLLAIPLFTLVITPLALTGALCPPLWDMGAWLVEIALRWLGEASHWPWAVWQAPAMPGLLAAATVVAGLAVLQPVPWRWRLLAATWFLPMLWLPSRWTLMPPPKPGQFSLVAADVGQGTAVLLRTANHVLLFDTGPKVGSQSDAGERVLLPLLRALGVRRLDTLLISHQDTDHIGGAATIVGALPVGLLLSSLDAGHSLRQQAGVDGVVPPHRACEAGQTWDWDGVHFAVLHPTAADLTERARRPPNSLSCVLRVQAQSGALGSALLTGDIEAQQERDIVARAHAQGDGQSVSVLKSTILLVPHHGSRTSSTGPFLQAVSPEVSVIQVGRRNAYGHPSKSVVARYGALGLSLAMSPRCGAWLWTSGEPAGRCWRDIAPHYWSTLDAGD